MGMRKAPTLDYWSNKHIVGFIKKEGRVNKLWHILEQYGFSKRFLDKLD